LYSMHTIPLSLTSLAVFLLLKAVIARMGAFDLLFLSCWLICGLLK
jgi:hypothetical protein